MCMFSKTYKHLLKFCGINTTSRRLDSRTARGIVDRLVLHELRLTYDLALWCCPFLVRHRAL